MRLLAGAEIRVVSVKATVPGDLQCRRGSCWLAVPRVSVSAPVLLKPPGAADRAVERQRTRPVLKPLASVGAKRAADDRLRRRAEVMPRRVDGRDRGIVEDAALDGDAVGAVAELVVRAEGERAAPDFHAAGEGAGRAAVERERVGAHLHQLAEAADDARRAAEGAAVHAQVHRRPGGEAEFHRVRLREAGAGVQRNEAAPRRAAGRGRAAQIEHVSARRRLPPLAPK